MILLISGATITGRRYLDHPHMGWLKTPRNRNSVASICATGVLWACDNDCFQQLDRAAYLAMLRQVGRAPRDRLLWVTAPDVVADAPATLARFRLWRPVLDYYGLPIAFVAQDGQEHLPVPWDHIRCLFVGGSTTWKERAHAERLVREAKTRGKWVHIGRVNTLRRRWLVDSWGADSIDGTCFSKWPDKFIPWMLRTLPYKQLQMEDLCLPES